MPGYTSVNGKAAIRTFVASNADKVVVLYFGTKWCRPCKQLKARLDDEHARLPGLRVAYIDAEDDANVEVAEKFEVSCFPTLLFVTYDGKKMTIERTLTGFDWPVIVATYNELRGD